MVRGREGGRGRVMEGDTGGEGGVVGTTHENPRMYLGSRYLKGSAGYCLLMTAISSAHLGIMYSLINK